MSIQKIISKETARSGDVFQVTEVMVTELTQNDLKQRFYNYVLQQNRIREQMQNLKDEFDNLELMKQETQDLLDQYETNAELPSV